MLGSIIYPHCAIRHPTIIFITLISHPTIISNAQIIDPATIANTVASHPDIMFITLINKSSYHHSLMLICKCYGVAIAFIHTI